MPMVTQTCQTDNVLLGTPKLKSYDPLVTKSFELEYQIR